ncbi:hypothetical protein [Candidatus Uabimicrobium sp. HlEnr_7]|uniref:hypothetical protein n=1 Tax=Candidatus Uabimicrobium helgolandensis TaxID=3095367 RepID=UPI003555D22B
MKEDKEILMWSIRPWELFEKTNKKQEGEFNTTHNYEQFQKQIDNWNSEIEFVDLQTYISKSKGKVTNSETVDLRISSGVNQGLFDPSIFGESRKQCLQCKKLLTKIEKCSFCQHHEILFYTQKDYLGYIKLSTPVVHPWFFGTISTFLGNLEKLRQLLYYQIYLVPQSGDFRFDLEHSISFSEYVDSKNSTAISGAHAIKKLLQNLSIEKIGNDPILIEKYQLYQKYFGYLISDVLPVIPTRFRPVKYIFRDNSCGEQDAGGINGLYRRVINRNKRLNRLNELQAPKIIIINEERMLQEAVDDLFANTKNRTYRLSRGNRKMESFVDVLPPLHKLSNDIGAIFIESKDSF